MVSLFCEVLRQMPELKANQFIGEQIKKFSQYLTRSNKHDVAERVSKFIINLDTEVTNMSNLIEGVLKDPNNPEFAEIFHRKFNTVNDK